MNLTLERFHLYLALMRFDRPVGSLLLLWPTLAAVWIAGAPSPPWRIVLIFVVGTFVMRAAGCVVNDFADRNFDRHVARTRERPLTTGRVSEIEALLLFGVLASIALLLVLMLNPLTQALSVAGLGIAVLYPFMKRWTYLPQVALGAAFSWAIPMAFAATQNRVPDTAWLMFVGSLLWIVAYDTQYAMVDRDDDLKIGIKSTAILFGQADRLMIGALQAFAMVTFALLGLKLEYSFLYYLGIVGAVGLFAYQHYLMRGRERGGCFAAFRNNVWVGFSLFSGVVLETALDGGRALA